MKCKKKNDAIKDLRVEVNGADTTTFYLRTEAARASPRPLGLITSSAGIFVNDGTTTQYSTLISGTSIDGHYAKVQSATSRVFSLIDDAIDGPTGIVSSTMVTRIRGETTTVETTQYVRTFIDQAYAQEILTSSEIFAPLRTDADASSDDDAINPSSPNGALVVPTLVIDSSLTDETHSDGGQRLFKTAHLTSLVGERVNIESSLAGVAAEDAADEDELTNEEHDRRKIISTSFGEQADNNLRDARAQQQATLDNLANEDVEPSKPRITLETFVAEGVSDRSPPARIEAEKDEQDSAPTDAPVSTTGETDQVELDQLSIVSTEAPIVVDVEDVQTEEPVDLKVIDDVSVTQPTNQLASDNSNLREPRVETAGPVTAPTTLSASRVRGTVTLSRNRGPVSQQSVPSSIEPNAPVSRSRTRSLSTISRAQATTTRPLVQPTGLLSTFEGSLVFDGITTVYTSSIFGTFIDGEYANIVSSTSTLIFPTSSAVVATPTVSLISSSIITPSPVLAVAATVQPEEPIVPSPPETSSEAPELDSSLNEPTEADPSVLLEVTPAITRLTTFTFFTTFFTTGADDEVVTSVSTREVISSEVILVEETAKILDSPIPIVTTQLTTFTYFETFFDDRTTQTQSREEVITNVVTLLDGVSPSTVTALDGNRLEATKTPDDRIGGVESSLMDLETSTEADADASGLTGVNVSSKRKQFFNSLASGIVKTFLTTFTFFTTALVNGTTRVSSRIVISTNAVTPTVSLTEIDEDLWESLKAQDDRSRSAEEISVTPTSIQTSETTSEVSDATTTTTSAPELVESQPPLVSPPADAEVTSSTDSTPSSEDETTVSSTTTAASVSSTTEEPQVSSSSAPEIDPSAPETGTEAAEEEAGKTFFTTFTYFTTFFNEGTSTVSSSESTVTNVVTDPAELMLMEATMSADADATAVVQPTIFPITYYTTYTYRTTSFIDEETTVITREETITNIVTPTVASILLEGDQSVVETLVTPTPTLSIVPTVDPGLITYYTTFTYFTTNLEEDTAVVTSSLETITNIVTVTPTIEASTARNIAGNSAAEDQLILDLSEPTSTKPQPTGLLSTIRSTQVFSDRTTIFTTDVLGTFINGQYARILESSSEVLDNARLPPTVIVAATGVQDVDTTDLFFPTLAPSGVDLEGSLLTPGSTTGQEDDASSGTRGPSRLNLINRNRTFSPSIRPFNQRPRPPAIGIKNNRKPGPIVANAAENNDGESTFVAGSFTPSAAGPQSTTRGSFSSRFRSSISAPASSNIFASTSSNAADGSSRSQFFRLRGSSSAAAASSASITPTPVLGFSSSRRFSGGFQAQSSSASPNSISVSLRPSIGIGARRPSILLAGASRSSSAGPVVSITTSRFGRPSTAAPPVEAEDIAEESSTGAPVEEIPVIASEAPVVASEAPVVAARPAPSIRRPSPLNRATGDSSAVAASPVQPLGAPTRRAFPLRSSTSRPSNLVTSSDKPVESGRSINSGDSAKDNADESSSSGATTGRPRFIRPPKVTFTEKPRPAVRLPTRPGSRGSRPTAAPTADTEVDQSADSSNVDPVVIERSKRQISFDYYFYDPIHYRRPSRGSSSRSRGRSSSRFVAEETLDYDYDSTPVKSRSPQAWEEFDYDPVEDEPVVTKPKAPSSALRDRINANKEKSAARASSTSTSTGSTRASSRTRTSSTGSSRSSSSGVSRMKKPVPEEVATAPKRTSSSRTSSSGTSSKARPRTKTSSATATERRGEVSSSSRRTFGNSGRGRGSSSSRGKAAQAANAFDDDGISLKSSIGSVTAAGSIGATAPLLTIPLSITHKVPAETVIPVLGSSGQTEFKTVITAKPSVEVISQYLTVKVSGTWRYIASEVSSTPSPGITVVTQYVLKPTETTAVTFTPTVIRGRQTSFSHIVPSTVYDVEPVVSTISDPVASTNSLLQQLLLGGLQQANNAQGQPVTSFSTHTSTYVTTLTELRSTKIPITLRGQEIFTTIVGTSTSVITATEFSTQTIVTGGQPTDTPVNPLVNLLPALLGNPLLAGQLLQPQQQAQPALQAILATAAPIQLTTATNRDIEADIFDDIQPFEDDEDQHHQHQQQDHHIEPEKPLPQTSVITLFLSGRRPGEFSSVLSTITLDGGSDSSVVKRQTSPDEVSKVMKVEPSSLPLMVGTDRGVFELPETYKPKDLDYYVMSAINEIGAEAIVDQIETQRLESVIRNAYVPKNVYEQPSAAAKARKVRQVLPDTDELLIAEEIAESNVDLVRVSLTTKSTNETPINPTAVSKRQGRRKTVTVTRKLSADNIKDLSDLEDFVSPNRARKVVIVNRKKSQEQETKQPIKENETPIIASSQFEDSERESSSPFGDIHAPRTFYTVYSYFYTLLNGPSSGSVSTREVSISEVVRGGFDNRLPSGFQRTENQNGIYSLSRGTTTADLSTRVNAGITTQVNLVSMTLVKYGRGSFSTASVTAVEKPVEKPVELKSSRIVNRLTVSATPKLEPSFEAFTSLSSSLRDEDTDPPAATQKLTTAHIRRTTAKSSSTTRKSVTASVEETSTKRTSRGRGTVRFNVASVLANEPDISSVLTTLTSGRSRGSAKALKQKEQQQRGTVRLTTSTAKRPSQPVRQHHDPADLSDQDYEDFHAFTDGEEFEDFEEFDRPLLGDYDEEFDEDEEEEHEELGPAEVPTVVAAESSSLLLSQPVPVVPPVSSTIRPTKLIGVTPTNLRTTISRKLINPLESHLSSILANSRSSIKAASSSGFTGGFTQQTTNDPGASASSFRTRPGANRGSNSAQQTSFQTSTVVLKTFETLSTLAVDGGRSGIPLTLITSSLTTLYDAELSLLTQSPQLFKQVIEPTLLPVSRPKQLNFNPTARLSLPVRASVAIGNSLLPSWSGSIEPSIEDTATETSTESTTDTPSSIAELLQQLAGSSFSSTITFVETLMRTFTAVVTRRSGDEEVVTTRLQVVPELVTKTIVPVQPTQGTLKQFFLSSFSLSNY